MQDFLYAAAVIGHGCFSLNYLRNYFPNIFNINKLVELNIQR